VATEELVIGIPGTHDLATLAPLLGEVLGVEFEDRESSHYAGGTYFLARADDSETIRVLRNVDAIDGTPLYENADTYPALLRLVLTERSPAELLRAIQTRVHPEAQILSQR
jgi:hypothetical protein